MEEKRTQKILLHSAKQKSVNLKHRDTTNQLLNRIFCCFKSICSLKLQIPSTKKHKHNRKASPFRRCIFLKNTGHFDCHPHQKKTLPTAISSLKTLMAASFESVKPFSPEPSTCALQVLLRRCEAFGKIQDFSV